jgi:N-acetylmuramoyl-L-alanine amidase
VKAGECLSSISDRAGHLWQTIWNHPSNSDLKQSRGDPHILFPGDQVFVPPICERVEYAATDQRHTYIRKCNLAKLRIVVKDLDEPVASQPYSLNVDGQWFTGVTDNAGQLELEIRPGAQKGHLIVGEGDDVLEYDFELGTLDPPDSITGIQARLGNLGYDVGPVDGIHGPKTTAAVEEFCAEYEIDPPDEGEITQAFCDKLAQEHGF